MDEIENFSEKIHEQSNEHAHHMLSEGKEKWVLYVALTTAVFAVLAAIAGLMAGAHADEAMLTQMKASDQWAFYQAKGIKSEMLVTSNKILVAMGKQPLAEDAAKVAENKTEQAKIKKEAEDFQKESVVHSDKHAVLAKCVTLFQVAIAIGAISIITKRKALWLGSMGFAAVGAVFFVMGLL
ncbi:MAG: DUF4337 domain-containing protein [Mucilaginibacter sp.]